MYMIRAMIRVFTHPLHSKMQKKLNNKCALCSIIISKAEALIGALL